MKFFETLRKGVHNIITNIKKDMAARAVENKKIKEIEQEAAFEERKKQAKKTAKYRVQLKGKQDREHIKNAGKQNQSTFGMGTQPGNMFDMPQEKQGKAKKQKKVQEQELFDPNTAMKMVNFDPFKTK